MQAYMLIIAITSLAGSFFERPFFEDVKEHMVKVFNQYFHITYLLDYICCDLQVLQQQVSSRLRLYQS